MEAGDSQIIVEPKDLVGKVDAEKHTWYFLVEQEIESIFFLLLIFKFSG